MTFLLTKGRTIMQRHNGQCQTGQSEDLIFFVSLTLRTCNVWHNVLSRICWSIGHYLKRSVDMLISKHIQWNNIKVSRLRQETQHTSEKSKYLQQWQINIDGQLFNWNLLPLQIKFAWHWVISSLPINVQGNFILL